MLSRSARKLDLAGALEVGAEAPKRTVLTVMGMV